MRGIFVVVLSVLSISTIIPAQVSSSANLGCGVAASGGMACEGPGGIQGFPDPTNEEHKLPKLYVTHFTIQPGGALERPSSSADLLIIGINGGDLLNEKAPFRHVSLAKDEVTLMPKEQAFRLRNRTIANVEFRLVEIQR